MENNIYEEKQKLWDEYGDKHNKLRVFREKSAPIELKQSNGESLSDEERNVLETLMQLISSLHKTSDEISKLYSKINQ